MNPHFINDVGAESDRPPDFTTNSEHAHVDLLQILFGARIGIGKDGTIYSANFGACRRERSPLIPPDGGGGWKEGDDANSRDVSRRDWDICVQ